MDLSQMSTADLQALYDQEKRKLDSGFVAGANNAPDKIAARQEYDKWNASLVEDTKAYKRVAPMRSQLDEFQYLNTRGNPGGGAATGSWVDAIPLVGGYAANIGGGPKSKMASIAAGMQVKDIVPGQGQISNFERALFALGQPGIDKQGPVNSSIINAKRALFNQEGDRLAFRQAFLRQNQTLNGADELWDRYIAENPYQARREDGMVTTVDPKSRTSWQSYFGVGPGVRAQGPSPAAPRKAASAPTGGGMVKTPSGRMVKIEIAD